MNHLFGSLLQEKLLPLSLFQITGAETQAVAVAEYFIHQPVFERMLMLHTMQDTFDQLGTMGLLRYIVWTLKNFICLLKRNILNICVRFALLLIVNFLTLDLLYAVGYIDESCFEEVGRQKSAERAYYDN